MDSRCPVCWSPVLDDLLICSGCNTRQHARCVASSGGCVVAGCTRPSRPVPTTPAENLAEARAARMARLAEAAREARALRAARPAPLPTTALDATPWRSDQRPTRPGNHLAGLLAVPPVTSTAHADPSRGFFGRLLDSAFETLAILPRALPLMLAGILLGLLPSIPYWLGLAPHPHLTWLFGLACSLAAPLLVYPAATLLVLEPDLRSAPWSTFLTRTFATWRRYIPTLLALAIMLSAPLLAMMPFFFKGGALPALAVFAYLYCAVQLAPVIACTSDPAPLASAFTLARTHKLAMCGAALATIALPSAASLMLQFTVIRHALFGWPYFVLSALAIQLVTRVFPLAYLSLLYRDLTAPQSFAAQTT